MIRIRELKARDRGNIYELMQIDDKIKPGEVEEVLHRIDLYLFDVDQQLYKVILAEDQLKELIGYAVYGPDPQASGTYKIYNLIHSPLTDNGDVLQNLLLFIEKDLLKNKGRIIVSEISSHHQYRNHFETYLNQNYNLSSVVSGFYSEGEDKLILYKNISTPTKIQT
jgi:hypothetical protein